MLATDINMAHNGKKRAYQYSTCTFTAMMRTVPSSGYLTVQRATRLSENRSHQFVQPSFLARCLFPLYGINHGDLCILHICLIYQRTFCEASQNQMICTHTQRCAVLFSFLLVEMIYSTKCFTAIYPCFSQYPCIKYSHFIL